MAVSPVVIAVLAVVGTITNCCGYWYAVRATPDGPGDVQLVPTPDTDDLDAPLVSPSSDDDGVHG